MVLATMAYARTDNLLTALSNSWTSHSVNGRLYRVEGDDQFLRERANFGPPQNRSPLTYQQIIGTVDYVVDFYTSVKFNENRSSGDFWENI